MWLSDFPSKGVGVQDMSGNGKGSRLRCKHRNCHVVKAQGTSVCEGLFLWEPSYKGQDHG